jgi:hypothetical protein
VHLDCAGRILKRTLKREVPEAMKPRKIGIFSPASKAVPFTAAA